jgi:hypothetical protein
VRFVAVNPKTSSMRNLVYLLLFGIAMTSSCSPDKNRVPEQAVIDLSGALKEDTVLMLSGIASDIEYVPLETTPDCMLGDYWNVRPLVLNNFILVSDKSQRKELPLKLFTRQGKYLGEIGAIGKGPDEFGSIVSYACLEEYDRIYILDRYPSKLLIFNFQRQCLGTIPVADRAAKVVAYNPDRIGVMYLPHNEMTNDTARFEWLDHTGKILESVPLYAGRPKDGGGMYQLSARLQQVGKELHFFERPFDTVYQLIPERGFKPVWSFKLGPDQMPRDLSLDPIKYNENFQNYASLERALETPDYFFINVIQKQRNKTIFYDIKSQSASWLRQNEGYEGFFLGTQGFVNDLDGGAPFWPNSRTGNLFVSITAPSVLIPAFKDHPAASVKLKNPELRERLFKMVDQLKDDDNPIVVIVH